MTQDPWITPNYRRSRFGEQVSLDDKVLIFEDRVQGWQLSIAQKVADDIRHSGFAVLHIVFSYFEMIAKFRDGFSGKGESKEYFKRGFAWVFPLDHLQRPQADKLLNHVYDWVRSGLYHSGITVGPVMLTGELQAPMAASQDARQIIINPHRLVPALQKHFTEYVAQLRMPSNGELRANFERRFDFQGA